MSVYPGDSIGNNKIDVSKTMWTDSRDDDKPGEVVSLDGGLDHPNEFQSQGSDANKGGGTRADNPPPPWVS
jgi:hypothetical protein